MEASYTIEFFNVGGGEIMIQMFRPLLAGPFTNIYIFLPFR